MADVSSIFYVKKRDDYQRTMKDFFPYLKDEYVKIAHNFENGKKYPVLAVKDVTVVGDNDETIETSRFLVPTENGNFLWVLCEVFSFAGLPAEADVQMV